jgi:hypothetical protein
MRVSISWFVSGVIVYFWLPPELTVVLPDGEMLPPLPVTLDVMVYVIGVKLATIVWLLATLEKV